MWGFQLMFIAICEGTSDEIYACSEREDDAKFLLFTRVKLYLKDRNAPRTQDFTLEQLEEYFGCVVVKVENNGGGFLK
jgi:hypothetical protein